MLSGDIEAILSHRAVFGGVDIVFCSQGETLESFGSVKGLRDFIQMWKGYGSEIRSASLE